MERGKYIGLEGADLSGKSTQAGMLHGRMNQLGYRTVLVREPGGTPMAEEIRTNVKNPSLERAARTNLWLFSAARVDLTEMIISPSLVKGTNVVTDRTWVSSFAYQGYGEGLNLEKIEEVTRLAIGGLMRPDKLFFLDIPDEERLARAEKRGDDPDYFERKGASFYERVRKGFLSTVKSIGTVAIDGVGTVDEVHERIWEHVEPLVEEYKND